MGEQRRGKQSSETYTQLSNENERKLDTSVEQVLKKDRKFIFIPPPTSDPQNKVQLPTLLCGLKYLIFPERCYEH